MRPFLTLNLAAEKSDAVLKLVILQKVAHFPAVIFRSEFTDKLDAKLQLAVAQKTRRFDQDFDTFFRLEQTNEKNHRNRGDSFQVLGLLELIGAAVWDRVDGARFYELPVRWIER